MAICIYHLAAISRTVLLPAIPTWHVSVIITVLRHILGWVGLIGRFNRVTINIIQIGRIPTDASRIVCHIQNNDPAPID